LGNGANVYLSSAELAAVCSILGKIPTFDEYMHYANQINETAEDTYRYLNFDRMDKYQQIAGRE
jgi:aconitate hydratase 2/2-methylisocitrate dehydratase